MVVFLSGQVWWMIHHRNLQCYLPFWGIQGGLLGQRILDQVASEVMSSMEDDLWDLLHNYSPQTPVTLLKHQSFQFLTEQSAIWCNLNPMSFGFFWLFPVALTGRQEELISFQHAEKAGCFKLIQLPLCRTTRSPSLKDLKFWAKKVPMSRWEKNISQVWGSKICMIQSEI